MVPSLVLITIVAVLLFFALRKKGIKASPLPDGDKNLLAQHVAFYRHLDDAAKLRFELKLQEFLSYVRIHGVNTTVSAVDKLLVASSAVIPIFGFPEWKYYNLRDVLLYPGNFNEIDFSTAGNPDVLGMVGDGAMQRMMILSKPALHRGFDHAGGKENTGIHEFVHLIDKEDGAVDGLPGALLEKQYTIPWLHLMAENIAAIKAGNSDINVYGATNHAEFFAVAAEYFFEQPGQFKNRHPELYELMCKIFHQHPPGE
jgi:Mlc titration factor MtfA (ptsG expression regulator)